MDNNVLVTRNLSKKYKNFFAVHNVNINIKKGQIYGLIGKNGAGKTTIIKMICSLVKSTGGEIELFSKTEEKDLTKQRGRIGCIIETPSFFPTLNARKNLEYYRIQKGILDKECVDKTLKLVGLSEVGKKKFKDFSLGMKQRLGLGLALLDNPDLLILDEPINGLDPTGIVEFRELILKLNREKNITVLISSHILGELSKIATNYGFIDKGEIIEETSAKEIIENCRQYLELTVDSTSDTVVVLEKDLNCFDYEVLSDSKIKIYGYVDEPYKVINKLVENNINIFSITQKGRSLEDYFVDLVGGNKND